MYVEWHNLGHVHKICCVSLAKYDNSNVEDWEGISKIFDATKSETILFLLSYSCPVGRNFLVERCCNGDLFWGGGGGVASICSSPPLSANMYSLILIQYSNS